MHIAAAEYPSVKARKLPDGQTATIEDICDFIVEYINSDVVVCMPFDISLRSIPDPWLRRACCLIAYWS